MPFKIFKTRTMPVGIDLGSAVVKMVQMRSTDGQLELLASARAEVPDDCRDDAGKRRDFLAGRLRNLLKDHGFKGRRCVLSLPSADTFVQHIKTARMPPEELDKALQWELEGKLPFDREDAIIRHMVVGQIQNGQEPEQEVIVVAVSRQSAEAYLEMAHSGKLEVIALDVESCAILECFSRLFRRADDAGKATLFLDLGETSTQVVIAHGAKLVFARNLVFGAGRIEKAAADGLGMSIEEARSLRRSVIDSEAESSSSKADRLYDAVSEPLEAVIGEITKCLRYYESVFPSKPVERAIFLGGQAKDRRLCQQIARQLNLPSQVGDPLARIKRTAGAGAGRNDELDLRQTQPEWAVAVGLSLGANQIAPA